MLNRDRVPKDLDDALSMLDELETKEKDYLRKHGHISSHHSFGMWLRNNWSLWEEETPLVLWFNGHQVFHADDMSGIIMEAFVCKLRGEAYNMQEQIDRYHAHWRQSGIDPTKKFRC